jgi:signal transduction histidine kinase
MAMSDVASAPGQVGESTAFAWPRFARWLFACAALAGLYYGTARLGYALRFAGPVAAIVWLPVGVAISFLSIFGLAAWPGVLIGDLLSNDYGALPVAGALGQTVGNMLEVLVAASLLRRIGSGAVPLKTMTGVLRLLIAIAVGTALSAIIGPLSLVLGGALNAHSLPTVFRTWWLGDFSGALVVVPLALAWWHRRPGRMLARRRVVEAALLFFLLALFSEIASRTDKPVTYLAFPALIWAAVRFGERGATLAVAVAVSVTVWSTTHYEGPFVFHSITGTVLSTQLFIAVTAVSSLCLAALVSEKAAFAERLGESRQAVFKAAESERRRIERNLHDGAQQRLLALGVRLRLVADCARDAPDPILPDLEKAEQELSLALDELRELSHGTHPSVLTELGLADAIRSVAARSMIQVTTPELPSRRAAEAAEVAAYYVVVEAVANAQKHAGASSVAVRVSSDGENLHVEVSDNGAGGAAERLGTGLRGLRERVEDVGGVFFVVSPAGRGTRVIARIPG